MPLIRKLRFVFALLALAALAACSFSTASDVTPPPGAEVTAPTNPPAQPTAAAQASPTVAITSAQTGPDVSQSTPAEELPAVGPVDVTGRVVNRSGGVVPTGLPVELQAFQGMEIIATRSAELGADGSFTFDAVEVVEGQVYIITVEYQGEIFGSDVIPAASLVAADAPPLEIAIYEQSADPSVLYADRAHVFINLLAENRLQVVEYLLISNPSDRVVVGATAGGPALSFQLPADAANLQFEEGAMASRFVPTEGGFGDLLSIRPGLQQHEVLFAYELPYDGESQVRLVFPVEVRSGVLAAPTGIVLEAPGLVETGEREMETGPVMLYSFAGLPAGTALEVSLSGGAGEDAATSGSSTTGLAIGLGAFALVLVLAGLWLRRKPAAEPPAAVELAAPPAPVLQTQEMLLDAIIELDQAYESGQLDRVPYLTRRAELKDRLKELREQ